jgi:hypothetical protein
LFVEILNPNFQRSRVAAPVVISSSNVKINRNLIDNPGKNAQRGEQIDFTILKIFSPKNFGQRNGLFTLFTASL